MSHLRSGFPSISARLLYGFLISNMSHPVHPPWFDHPNRPTMRVLSLIMKLLIMHKYHNFSHVPVASSILGANILLSWYFKLIETVYLSNWRCCTSSQQLAVSYVTANVKQSCNVGRCSTLRIACQK
jgi:hypothetical protein